MSWGETFLPQGTLSPEVDVTAEPASRPDLHVEQPASMVRLGFADGTQCELASGTEHFDHLVAIAARLTRSSAHRSGS
jgi:hypothetical protein